MVSGLDFISRTLSFDHNVASTFFLLRIGVGSGLVLLIVGLLYLVPYIWGLRLSDTSSILINCSVRQLENKSRKAKICSSPHSLGSTRSVNQFCIYSNEFVSWESRCDQKFYSLIHPANLKLTSFLCRDKYIRLSSLVWETKFNLFRPAEWQLSRGSHDGQVCPDPAGNVIWTG